MAQKLVVHYCQGCFADSWPSQPAQSPPPPLYHNQSSLVSISCPVYALAPIYFPPLAPLVIASISPLPSAPLYLLLPFRRLPGDGVRERLGGGEKGRGCSLWPGMLTSCALPLPRIGRKMWVGPGRPPPPPLLAPLGAETEPAAPPSTPPACWASGCRLCEGSAEVDVPEPPGPAPPSE